MELRTLEYFVAVAEERSFTKAAARCHVVQPAISQQIQALEKELGEPLFERLPRQVVLTSGGAALLPHARACLAAAASAVLEFADRSGLLAGSFALGTVGGLEGTVIPSLLGEYHRRYPRVAVSLTGASSPALLAKVRDGEIDAAVVAGPPAVVSVLGALAASTGVVATATPAAAFAGVFIYANPNYSIPVYPSGAPVQVAELTGSGKDSTSSIGNSTNLSMCFYEHKNYGGLEFRIGPGEWWATIPSWIDNKISSYRPC